MLTYLPMPQSSQVSSEGASAEARVEGSPKRSRQKVAADRCASLQVEAVELLRDRLEDLVQHLVAAALRRTVW
jgi:hypothetical protein